MSRTEPHAPQNGTAEPTRRANRRIFGQGVVQKSWPPILAIIIVLALWQVIYLTGWRPSYVLPDPAVVLYRVGELLTTAKFWTALGTTLLRAATGFAIAVTVGTVIGLLVSRSRILRAAIGSLITGLQTMPSIAWFPFAILIFGLSEQAILFVVILGAAPSIANGIISGIDDVPTALLRTATALGARGFVMYRYIVVPAALPAYISGLKQGWAFAWRSLMAGELLVIIASRPSLGVELQFYREFADTTGLMAIMIIILALGMLVDGGFNSIARRVRRKRGLALTD
ncbi:MULTISPECIES: ABC transporter permease [unclassified Arthrobacter]|uniref:ABC transporter permease n=1 Tax=unclassified Arthrobacter TaxID=235627 RepID=UPI00149099A1|nr:MULTISPECIES: ABC transporter permease [unclassified Arthrobacter]MBE0008276.1 ABC transporter permease [Arthrobacter sp. AET 35A]NOJ62015.1 ABC transporter permease [Arthrobacter sp. 147(2020)]